jgi:glyceraldehyde 3-phosphate dehydrogenase
VLRVAINGYGRIGRIVHRQLLKNFAKEVEVVAVNASSDAAMRAYLLKYDSLHGRFDGEVEVKGDDMLVNGNLVAVLKVREPGSCPWQKLGVDVVVESSGKFRTRELAQPHVAAGAKAVIVTAPPKDDLPLVVRGVNDDALARSLPIFSAASCTTNCIAPILSVLDSAIGIAHGLVSTTHAYTASQNLLDNKTDSSKIRIARAAALSIIPSTTGAVKACANLFPHLEGKLSGLALRVPVPTVSVAVLALSMARRTTGSEVHALLRQASEDAWKGILGFEAEQLVSADYVGDPRSCIIDADSTDIVDGTLLQLLAWYDNEWGYSMRITELVVAAGKLFLKAKS